MALYLPRARRGRRRRARVVMLLQRRRDDDCLNTSLHTVFILNLISSPHHPSPSTPPYIHTTLIIARRKYTVVLTSPSLMEYTPTHAHTRPHTKKKIMIIKIIMIAIIMIIVIIIKRIITTLVRRFNGEEED